MGNVKIVQNHEYQKKAGRRWTWKSPTGVTKTEIDYIITNRPDIVTYVTVIIQVNIGNDHRLVMSNDQAERTKMMRPPRVDAIIGSKKIKFQLEMRNRFETLQELYDIDTMRETIRYMIQLSASRVAKAINKPHKLMMSLPKRALMTKQREMAEHGDNKQRTVYAEICKTIKKQQRTSGNTTKR